MNTNSQPNVAQQPQYVPPQPPQPQPQPPPQPQPQPQPQLPPQPQYQPQPQPQYHHQPPQRQQPQGDLIRNLPNETTPVGADDKRIVDAMLGNTSTSSKIFNELKDALIGAGLFIGLSLPQLDTLLDKIMTYKSPYVYIVAKACVFIVLFYLLKNVVFPTR